MDSQRGQDDPEHGALGNLHDAHAQRGEHQHVDQHVEPEAERQIEVTADPPGQPPVATPLFLVRVLIGDQLRSRRVAALTAAGLTALSATR